jgi:predicted O-methyltransferase YrrM
MRKITKIEYTVYDLILKLYNKIRTRRLNKNHLLSLVQDAKNILFDPKDRIKYLDLSGIHSDNLITLKADYIQHKKEINNKVKYFDDKWFQCGSLDDEIDLIVDFANSINAKKLLEIGVANGYSSSMLYKYAEMNTDVEIVSIDLPRFELEDQDMSLLHKTIKKVSMYSKIKTTGTVLDIKPGGIVPREKWCGWLVPHNLRKKVNNILYIGDVFSVIKEFTDDKFDLIVVDAMKDYESRYKLLNKCYAMLNSEGYIILDGAWINPAFEDFCSNNNLVSHAVGRVSWAKLPKK